MGRKARVSTVVLVVCIGIFTFFLVIILLSLRISNVSGRVQSIFSKYDVFKVQHVPLGDPSEGFLANNLRAQRMFKPGSNIYKHHTNIWSVVRADGVLITSDLSMDSPVVDVLPLGLIVTGNTVVQYLDAQSGSSVSRLYTTYPVAGWVTITTALSASKETKDPMRNALAKVFLRPVDPSFVEFTKEVSSSVSNERAGPADAFCSNVSHHKTAFDYKGGDLNRENTGPALINPVMVPNSIQCCLACSNNIHCERWTMLFGSPQAAGGEGQCWMKNGQAVLVSSAKPLVSGVSPPKAHSLPPGITAAAAAATASDAFVVQQEPTVASTRCCPLGRRPCGSPELTGTAISSGTGSSNLGLFQHSIAPAHCLQRNAGGSKLPVASVSQCIVLGPRKLRADESSETRKGESIFKGRSSEEVLLPAPVYVLDAVSGTTDSESGHCGGGSSGASRGEARSTKKLFRSSSNYVLLQTKRVTANWMDQQPIGNGRFGALVGGGNLAWLLMLFLDLYVYFF
jgi:hypothetical protein